MARNSAIGRAARSYMLIFLVTIIGGLVLATSARAQPMPSGLPLPRFASLAGERINVRTGPGKQYPIRYVYARAGLPVKIVAEFDTWRKIEDFDGDQGWVHVSLLSGRRTVMIAGQIRDLRRDADESAPIVVRAEPGVICRLVACKNAWCEVEAERNRGWVERTQLWGTLDSDAVP